jgi:hypothetical protein
MTTVAPTTIIDTQNLLGSLSGAHGSLAPANVFDNLSDEIV